MIHKINNSIDLVDIWRHGWDMRETSIMDNLNCKMQAHARVCKENKSEEKQVDVLISKIQALQILYLKVARNYSYVASTTAINNAAASQLPAIKLITR